MAYEFLNWFSELGQLTSLVTFAVTVLGMLSLLLVNMGRYLQSKKFGIPLRNVHQANIAESAELWIALMGSLGFGVLLPVVFLNVELGPLALFPILFVFFFLGFVMTKHATITTTGKTVVIDGKDFELQYNTTLIFYTIRSIPASFAYLRLHRIHYEVFIAENELAAWGGSRILTVLMVCAFIYYFFFLFGQLKGSLYGRLFGNASLITAEIDGKKYFVAMRHNQYQWFLMEYEIEERTELFSIGKFYRSRYIIRIARFSEGEYIIRDLSELEGPLETENFSDVRDKNKLSFFTYAYEVKPKTSEPTDDMKEPTNG